MHIRVQIPAYNEEKTLRQVVTQSLAILRLHYGRDRVSVLVINDGSVDKTTVIARDLAQSDPAVVLVEHARNQGLGVTFAAGIRRSIEDEVDVLVHLDADGQFDPKDIPQLVDPIRKGEVEWVTATRFLGNGPTQSWPWVRKWGNRFLAQIMRWITQEKISDVTCGFRAYSRTVLTRLRPTLRYTYTHETMLSCLFAGLPFYEIPVFIRPNRQYGRSVISSNPFRYAFHAAWALQVGMRRMRPIPYYSTLLLLLTVLGFTSLWVISAI